MTDPFDFEPRFEARITAHAARASRPFDAAAIAAAATAGSTHGIAFGALGRSVMGRDGRVSTVRVAFTLLLLATVVTAGTLLVGAALRGQPPLPDHLAVVPPTASASPTQILEDRPTPVPEATPPASTPQPATATPVTASDRLALIRRGAKHCGEVVTTIVIDTGASRNLGGCSNVVGISPDGTRAIVGGGTNVVDPADPDNSWLASGDPNRFEVVDLRDGTSHVLGTDGLPAFTNEAGGYVSWSPRGRWIVRQGQRTFWIRSSALPITDGSGWVELPALVGTSGLFWSPDEAHLGIRTAAGFVIGDGTGPDLRPLDGIPWISSWSADGSRIAFPHTGAYDQVWVGNVDGTDQALVSDRGGRVQLSSDGRQVAILEGGHLLRWRLSDGTWREVDLPVNLDTREPGITWTPAGDALVVSARNDPDANGGPGTTFLISIDGTILARVDGSDPTWSPDGSRFAVSVSPDDLDPNGTTAPVSTKARGSVYLVARDGTTIRIKDAYAPAWSPDGSSIAVLTGDPVATGVADPGGRWHRPPCHPEGRLRRRGRPDVDPVARTHPDRPRPYLPSSVGAAAGHHGGGSTGRIG